MKTKKKKELSYSFRERLYNREKQELLSKDLTPKEYEAEVKRIADKYRI